MPGSGPPLQDLLAGDWLFLHLAVRVGRKSRAADLHVAREQGSSCVLGGAGLIEGDPLTHVITGVLRQMLSGDAMCSTPGPNGQVHHFVLYQKLWVCHMSHRAGGRPLCW